MKIKILSNILLVIGILSVLILANLQLIMVALSPAPFSYKNVPFSTNQREYHRTDRIVMNVIRCSTEPLPVAVVSVKELYNPTTGEIVPLPPGSGIIPPGCSDTETAFISVFPQDLKPGNYVIRGVTTFRGKFITTDVAWQTQSFMIKE